MRQWGTTVAAAVIAMAATAQAQNRAATWQDDFAIKSCNLVTTGQAKYMVLEPGFQLVLESRDTKLEITVLDETKVVDGVTTRVVEEREWVKGKLYEVARNYFAICEATKDVYYFGEDVDFYENDRVVKHDGTWHAGGRNRPGMIMPGDPKVGMRYYQEIAPSIAMDRAEIVSVTDTCRTPAGVFQNCLKVHEGSALDPTASENKYHAPGIGLVRDEDLILVRYGRK